MTHLKIQLSLILEGNLEQFTLNGGRQVDSYPILLKGKSILTICETLTHLKCIGCQWATSPMANTSYLYIYIINTLLLQMSIICLKNVT